MKIFFYTKSNMFIPHNILRRRCRPTVTMFHLDKTHKTTSRITSNAIVLKVNKKSRTTAQFFKGVNDRTNYLFMACNTCEIVAPVPTSKRKFLASNFCESRRPIWARSGAATPLQHGGFFGFSL